MRKIMSLSVAVMVALVAIGTWATWATATTNSPAQIGNSGDRINVMELMSSAADLPAQQYEAF